MQHFTKTNEFNEIEINDQSITEVDNFLKELLSDVRNNEYEKNADACYRCGYHKDYCEGV